MDLSYEEEALGKNPKHVTVRLQVSYEAAGGAKEHCGYLNVRLPIGDDPSLDLEAQAAELIERSSWAEPNYSFSYSSVDD